MNDMRWSLYVLREYRLHSNNALTVQQTTPDLAQGPEDAAHSFAGSKSTARLTKMTSIPLYHAHAFSASRLGGGNPAAVALLAQPLDDATRQLIAADMNLAETAFVEPVSLEQSQTRL